MKQVGGAEIRGESVGRVWEGREGLRSAHLYLDVRDSIWGPGPIDPCVRKVYLASIRQSFSLRPSAFAI